MKSKDFGAGCRLADAVFAVFSDCRFLGFFGADVAKMRIFFDISSVLMIGIPVSLSALSMPTRGAGR